MANEKKSNIIFMEGKSKLLENLFNSTFGYLAVGYSEDDNTNGFINVDSEDDVTPNGFYEISEDSTYTRVPLSFNSIIDKDNDNGRITAKFTAELDLDNIISDTPINQIAIVDNKELNSPTTLFAAAVTETYVKNEQLALVFVIEITM